MDELKPESPRHTFWCGILSKENTAAAPAARTRTVRGPYTAFTSSATRSDNTYDLAGQRTNDGKSKKS